MVPPQGEAPGTIMRDRYVESVRCILADCLGRATLASSSTTFAATYSDTVCLGGFLFYLCWCLALRSRTAAAKSFSTSTVVSQLMHASVTLLPYSSG